jgi:hypothetical protein
MSDVIADLVVTLVVAASVGYSAWRLGPERMRQLIRLRFGRFLPAPLRSTSGSACGGCNGCAAAKTAIVRKK